MTKSIAMLIPSTTKFRDWKQMEDTYLYKYQKLYTQYEVTYYIGYDFDDPIYSKENERNKFKANWIECNFDKGNVVAIWNYLFEKAKNKYDYYWIVGDDIKYPQKPIGIFELLSNSLDKNKGLGIAGCFNGNPNLPMTQFLITDIHYKIFGYVFPPEIKNYFCDNWMLMLYKDNTFYFPNISAMNSGGEPRYQPIDAAKICGELADRDRRKLDLYKESIK
jgi:hypothetical protein